MRAARLLAAVFCAVMLLAAPAWAANFSVSGGKIYDPNGKLYIPVGINLEIDEAPFAVTNSSAQPLTTLFPGINHIRFNVSPNNSQTPSATYPTPASMATVINNMTAAHIVVEIDDHGCNGGYVEGPNGATSTPCAPPTGSTLTPITNWYTAMAQYYANNPYVWFGTLNEINSSDGTYNTASIAPVSTYEVAVYNAIRTAGGSQNMIQMEAGIGGGNCGTVGSNGGYIASDYTSMHNIIWELHAYYNDNTTVPNSGYTTAAQLLNGQTAAQCGGSGGSGYLGAQTIQSADGVVPVIYGEWGSADGNASSTDASQLASGMETIASSQGWGNTGWGWYPSTTWQMVINGDTSGGPFSLTTWGGEMAGVVANIAPLSGGGGTAPPPAYASALGYTNVTLGPSLVVGNTPDPTTSYPEFTGSVNWVPFTFYGTTWKGIGYVTNADGSITLDGTGEGTNGYGLSTAASGNPNLTTNRLTFTGTAFGGGFYAEAVMKSNGTPMAFWANDIETMNGASVNAGPYPWPGQASGYGDWTETDIAEFDCPNGQVVPCTGGAAPYGIAVHNWYGPIGGPNVSTNYNKVNQFLSPLPDFTQYHRYGALWVPATASAQGYMAYYFDGTLVSKATWNQYDPTAAPPPVATLQNNSTSPQTWGNSTAFSVMDKQHLALIVSGYPQSTTTIQSVTVWQASTAGNLVNGASPTNPGTKIAVPAPLTGTVSTQAWASYDQSFSGITLACGKPFHFNVLPPAQYNGTAYKYPLLIWLHPDFQGDPWYLGSNTNPTFITGDEAANFNTVPFLTAYPAFVVAPYADQTNGNGSAGSCGGDGNDAVQNWGGWTNNGSTGSGTVYSGDTGPNVFALLDMINYLETQYSIDTSRIYVEGFSLGGIGAEYLMQKYNTINGVPSVFASGASMAGVLQINGFAAGPTSAQETAMTNVPVWWFGGTNDTQSVQSQWNEPMFTSLSGGSSAFPSAITSVAANKAGSSAMEYTLCPSCGHQDTDASGNPVWVNATIMNWMFGVTGGGGCGSNCGGGGGGATTWDPARVPTGMTLSNSNQTASTTSAPSPNTITAYSTTSYSTGKYCFGVVMSTGNTNFAVGIANNSFPVAAGGTGGLGSDADGEGFYPISPTQAVYYAGVQLSAGSTADANGDEVDECVDFGTNLVWISTPVMRAASTPWNNAAIGSQNPAGEVGGLSISGLTCPCFIAYNAKDTPSVATLNAAGPLAVSLPSGFNIWQPASMSTHSPMIIFLGKNDNMPLPANDNRMWYQPVDYRK
jgi:predicted esterase